MLCTLALALSASLDPDDRGMRLAASDGVWSATAVVTTGEFDRSVHTYSLKKLSPETSQRVFIDGRFAWGLEGTDVIEYPAMEIRSIVLKIGDSTVTLPPEAFSDCYEPPTLVEVLSYGKPTGYKLGYLWVSSKKARATLKLICSDGTGSYRVLWHVNADGTWKREFVLV